VEGGNGRRGPHGTDGEHLSVATGDHPQRSGRRRLPGPLPPAAQERCRPHRRHPQPAGPPPRGLAAPRATRPAGRFDRPRYRALVLVAALTGLRWGEPAALRWDDPRLDQPLDDGAVRGPGRLRIARAISDPDGPATESRRPPRPKPASGTSPSTRRPSRRSWPPRAGRRRPLRPHLHQPGRLSRSCWDPGAPQLHPRLEAGASGGSGRCPSPTHTHIAGPPGPFSWTMTVPPGAYLYVAINVRRRAGGPRGRPRWLPGRRAPAARGPRVPGGHPHRLRPRRPGRRQRAGRPVPRPGVGQRRPLAVRHRRALGLLPHRRPRLAPVLRPGPAHDRRARRLVRADGAGGRGHPHDQHDPQGRAPPAGHPRGAQVADAAAGRGGAQAPTTSAGPPPRNARSSRSSGAPSRRPSRRCNPGSPARRSTAWPAR
jgi:hypothetical protein